jgi:phospholipid/cholesterol/gamma-HCH transport system ATP-binding protein
MIRFKNVHKSFGAQHVLKGVNLSLEPEKITAIMGPSGEGKSVLLKHIMGLLRPDSGEVYVDGEEITQLNDKEMNRVRRKIGMLFQDAALFDDMDVLDNVSFPLYEHTRLSDAEVADRVHEMLAEVGLKNIDAKLPSELSGGMRKRVGLARAMMLEPKILLFDEPTTGLDPIITNQIADLMLETHQRHKVTMVLISHDLGLSYKIADRIAMLYQGHIIENVTPPEFKESSHPFVRKFLAANAYAEET